MVLLVSDIERQMVWLGRMSVIFGGMTALFLVVTVALFIRLKIPRILRQYRRKKKRREEMGGKGTKCKKR